MLLSLAVAATLILIAAAAGWYAPVRAAAPDWFTRMAAAIVPPAAMCLAVQAAATIALGTFFVWDDIRLARSVSLLHGYRLYYGPDEIAPIIGTLHTPLTQLIYVPLGFLSNPTAALITG